MANTSIGREANADLSSVPGSTEVQRMPPMPMKASTSSAFGQHPRCFSSGPTTPMTGSHSETTAGNFETAMSHLCIKPRAGHSCTLRRSSVNCESFVGPFKDRRNPFSILGSTIGRRPVSSGRTGPMWVEKSSRSERNTHDVLEGHKGQLLVSVIKAVPVISMAPSSVLLSRILPSTTCSARP